MKVAHWLKYDGALEKCWRSGNEMKILFGAGWDKKNSGGMWNRLDPRDIVMASPYERMLSFNYQ